MSKFLNKAVLAVGLAASTLIAAAPAEAQRYRYHNRHRGNGGTAVVAGIAGLAIGAALASNANDRYRNDYYRSRGYRYDYDDYYYRQRGYYPTDGYYAYRYRDYGRCYTERRYDPYYGRRVKVRVCN